MTPKPGPELPAAIESRILDVPAAGDAGTGIPITVIRGARPGPVLALIAGNHGYEYPPILALQRLRGQIDPAELSGGILMVHTANMPSFPGRTVYVSPVDGKNLNRLYPGRIDGTVSERIAHAITSEAIRAGRLRAGPALRRRQRVAAALRLPARHGQRRPGSRHRAADDGFRHRPLGGGPRPAHRPGPLALLFHYRDHPRQTGHSRRERLSGSVRRRIRGADRHRDSRRPAGVAHERGRSGASGPGRLPGSHGGGDRPGNRHSLLSGGVRPDGAKRGLLAHITDFFGKTIAEVRSPLDGLVLYIVATPPIAKGQPVGSIGVPRAAFDWHPAPGGRP